MEKPDVSANLRAAKKMTTLEALNRQTTQETSSDSHPIFTFSQGLTRYYLHLEVDEQLPVGLTLVMLPKGAYLFIRISNDCQVKIIREATYQEIVDYPDEPLSAGFFREKEKALLAPRR